jgi:hypothetical protein
VAELTRLINKFIARPWDQKSIDGWREVVLRTSKERKALDAAAAILARDADGYQQLLENADQASGHATSDALVRIARTRIAALKRAIEELKRPRGWSETLNFPRRFIVRGPSPRPWAMMVPELVQATIAARKAAGDKRAGIGTADGPVIKFVQRCLTWILPGEAPPAGATILEVARAARPGNRS